MTVTPINTVKSLKLCAELPACRDCTKCMVYDEEGRCQAKLMTIAAEMIDTLLTLAASSMVEARMQSDYIAYLGKRYKDHV